MIYPSHQPSYEQLGLRSFNPRVCMDPKVHYTTQSAAFERLAASMPVKSKENSKVPTHKTKSARSERRLGKQVAFNILKDLGI